MSDTTALTAPVSKAVAPGWKTSEFWLTTAAQIIGALMASGVITDGGLPDKIIGVAAMLLTTLGYQVARTRAKA